MMTKNAFARLGLLLAPLSLGALLGADAAFARGMDSDARGPSTSGTSSTGARSGAEVDALRGTADDPAQAGPESIALMEQLDQNKDEYISRDEARETEQVDRIFESADENDDGRLSSAELRKGLRG